MSAGCGPVFRVFKVAQSKERIVFQSFFLPKKKTNKQKENQEEKATMMTHPNLRVERKTEIEFALRNHLPEQSSCFHGPPLPLFTSRGPARERHSESAGESGVGVRTPSTMALPSASSISSRFLVPEELIFLSVLLFC
jgi:hypothetical protein